MEEENKSEEESSEKEKEEDNSSSESTKLERAEKAVKNMKEQNDRFEKLIERQETAKIEDTLGGKSDAGQAPEKPKEETATEYKDKIMSGIIE